MVHTFLIALGLFLAATSSHATLLGRAALTPGGADYRAYYDDVLNITWVADANLAGTSLNWQQAQDWTASLNTANYLGTNGWRLPKLAPINGVAFNYTVSYVGASDFAYNISAPGTLYGGSTANELAHLYYNTLHGTSDYTVTGQSSPCGTLGCLADPAPFTNVVRTAYWFGVPGERFPSSAWGFNFGTGVQGDIFGPSNQLFAWAVADGDPLATVPVPAAAWLFGSAVAALGLARRRTTQA